jgi:hypothetical protein
MSAEKQAIAAIDAAEAMALANVELIRQMKKILPKPLSGLTEVAVTTNTAGIKTVARVERKTVRKASAYSKKYGRAFKQVASKFKKKGGGWKKNGFKNAQKAAHKKAKTMK